VADALDVAKPRKGEVVLNAIEIEVANAREKTAQNRGVR